MNIIRIKVRTRERIRAVPWTFQSWVKWFPLYHMASFLDLGQISLPWQPSPPSIYSPCCHTLCRMLLGCQREKHRGSHVFIKHYISACVSKPNEHIEVYLEVPFPHHSQHFKGLGTVFCHMAGSIKLCSIPLHLPFSPSFIKCSDSKV